MTTIQDTLPIQYLLTLPPRMAAEFEELEGRRRPEWFAASDPPGQALGSGGGTASLLAQAWRQNAPEESFDDWLRKSRKLILHAGGQSRRLPAYALVGKLLMPIPVFRWARGQRLDQTLLDLQLPDYQRVLAHAPPGVAAMVTSGDVLLRFARACGSPRNAPATLAFFARRAVIPPNWLSSCKNRLPPKSANWPRIIFAWWTPGCGS
jgi:hypothetical protein